MRYLTHKLAILLFFLLMLSPNLALSQDNNPQNPKKLNDYPVFESPQSVIQKNYKKALERFDELEKLYQSKCPESLEKIQSISKSVEEIVDLVPEPKSLVFTVNTLKRSSSFSTLLKEGNTDYFYYSPDMAEASKLPSDYFNLTLLASKTFRIKGINDNGQEVSDVIPLQGKLINKGPFVPAVNSIFYIGGTGLSSISWVSPVSNHRIDQTFTANLVDVLIDNEMRDTKIAIGGSYKTRVVVFGPANMNDFNLNWSVSGPAKWKETSTGFFKDGDLWVSENYLLVDISEDYNSLKNKLIEFKITMPSSERANGFEFKGRVTTDLPVAEDLIIKVKYGNSPPEEVNEIDLFVPNVRRLDIQLIPYIKLRGIKEPVSIAQFPVGVEFKSTNPYAATIMPVGKVVSNSIYSDETEITARINGYLTITSPEKTKVLELADGKKSISSKPVFVNVNVILLSSQKNKEGKTEYTLTVSGPTNMEKYSAKWMEEGFLGTNTYNTSFSTDGQAYVTKLTTSFKIKNIQIVSGNRIVAELATGTVSQSVGITILPSSPPTAIIKKVENEQDFDNFNQCVSEVTRWMDMWGFEPGKSPEGYCRDRMKKQADSAQLVEKQNKYIRELNQKGYELVTFSDEMKVGAMITGLKKEHVSRSVCKWQLKTDTKLYLETDVTTIQTDNTGISGCFNKVKGIKENFDPEAELSVELVLDTQMPDYPLFTEAQTIDFTGNMFGR